MDVQVGDRIRLDEMGNDPDPIPVGTTGTVRRVHELTFAHSTQLSVEWDIKRSLHLCCPPDKFTVIERRIHDSGAGAAS